MSTSLLRTMCVGILTAAGLASAQKAGTHQAVNDFSYSYSGSSSDSASSQTTVTSVTTQASFAASRTAPHVVVSGTSVTVPVHVVSGNPAAASAFTVRLYDPTAPVGSAYDYSSRVSYQWNYRSQISDSRNWAAGSVDFGGATTSASVTITAYCAINDTMFSAQLVSSAGAVTTIGQVYCVHAFPTSAPALPNHVHVWISTKSYLSLAHTLLAAWSNWGSAGVALAGNGQLSADADFVNYTTFASFQSKANELVDGVTDANSCDGFSASTFSSRPNGLVILAGAYKRTGTCATSHGFNAVYSWLMTTDVIVVADALMDTATLTNSMTQTVTLGYPDASAVAVRMTLERYNLNRFERQTSVCGTQSNLVTIPATGTMIKAKMLESRTFYWNGLCGITQCCIGSKCSSEIAADGRSCVLPRVTTYGTQVGITLKRGTESFYVHLYLSYGYTRGVYGSTQSYYTPLTDNAAGTQVLFRRNTAARNYCVQLSCIPSAASLTSGGITAYSNVVCPSDADWTLPGWYLRYAAFYQQYSYSWTYYYYSVYGWAASRTADKKEYVATFTRPSVQSACSCSAIGITSFEHRQMLFPATSRFFNGSTGAAVDVKKYAKKDMQISKISPMPTTASAADRKNYCNCWAKNDATNAVVAQRAAVASSCFQCPAMINPATVLPRNFWRVWSWGSSWYNNYYGETGNSTTQRCFRAVGNMQAGRVPWARRCCYNRVNSNNAAQAVWKYIPAYPSKLAVSTGWGRWPDYYTERVFSYATDVNPEQVCCRHSAGGLASTDATCRLYRDRRPVQMSTTSPFRTPRGCAATWTPAPPRGWGRGDPYCTTMDGAGFECNFWGEALWTSCGGWKVHTAAEPVSDGAKATIITAVAVSEGNETVVIQRNNVTGDSEVRLNGEEQFEDFEGVYLSVTFDETSNNLTIVRVISVAGNHSTEVETQTSSLTLSVAPDASCIGACSGLMGNCDGDATNDIKSLDGTVSLAANASGDVIFANVVTSFLINNTASSLFDYNVSVPTVATPFVPNFVSVTTMSNCPSACNNDPGCCLDNEVAGPTFAAETVATVSVIEEVKNSSVPLTGYNWPPTVSLNPNVAVLNGLAISQEITATDSDGLTSLTIDACNDADVTCTQDTTVTTSTTIKKIVTTTASRNFTITVTAVDAKGASTTAYMTVSSLPPPPVPATSATFMFTVPGTGFNAGHVYEARLAIANDLAAIVNAYWNLNRRQTVTAAPGATGTPAYTAASQFTVSAVVGVTDAVGVANGVKVTVYIAGDTTAEANSRLAALTAQSSLTLTTTQAALSSLVPTAVTTTDASSSAASSGSTGTTTATTSSTSTGTTTTGSSTSVGTIASSTASSGVTFAPSGGNAGASSIPTATAALMAVFCVFVSLF